MGTQTKPSALIVDDSASARATFAALMEADFDLAEAASCKQALRAMRSSRSPAVVLCDYQLEDGLGTDVLRELAERHPLATATLVTAHGSLDLALESINGCLAHRFVQKGAPLRELKSAIDACLSEHRQREHRLKAETSALNGSVAALVESICIQEPRVRRLSARVNRLIQASEDSVSRRDQKDMRIASLVIYIGMLKVPMEIVHSVFDGRALRAEDWRLFRAFPDHTIEMIQQFPKLHGSVTILRDAFRTQAKTDAAACSLAAQTLHVSYQAAWLIERLGCCGASAVLLRDADRATTPLARRRFEWAAKEVRALSKRAETETYIALDRTVSRLLPGDVLLEDVFDSKGKLLLARGGTLNRKTLDALRDAIDQRRFQNTLEILRATTPDALNARSSDLLK